MEKREIEVLLKAAQVLNKEPASLKAENPFLLKGPAAEAIQMAAETIDPNQAAAWRMAAGIGGTLETAAVTAGVLPMNASAHSTLMQNDPTYRQGVQDSQVANEAQLLAQMDAAADELRGRKLHETPQAAGRWQVWQAGQDALKAAELKQKQG